MSRIFIINFFKNRFNILYIIVVLIIIALSFKLATLTIVEGEKYRQEADIKKIKDIPVKAPRGKIYDRNGVILADNLTSFTVQIYKNKIKAGKFSEIMHTLTTILDENGEDLIDDFPIELDTFEIINKEEYSGLANEYVINAIQSNNLTSDWINSQINLNGEIVTVKSKVYKILSKEIKDLPISYENNSFSFTLKEDKLKNWLKGNNIDENITSDGLVEYYLNKENRYMLSLLSNSKIRNYTYVFLNSKKLIDNVKLIDYSLTYDKTYESIKKSFSTAYEGITYNSSAKDDFVYLVKYEIFDNLFGSSYGEEKNTVIPGKLLIDELTKKYPDLPIKISTEDNQLAYEYTDVSKKGKFISMLKLESTVSAYQLLRSLALYESTIISDVITSDTVCSYAQHELLNRGINPNISIATWEYTAIRDKNLWLSSIEKSGVKLNDDYTVKDIFEALRDKLKLEEKLDDYDVRNILVIQQRYNNQGYLSYHPIDICYNVSETTVAMISERSHELYGVNIEIEPIRYYPEKSLAAHVLGYLGKISQESEIEEYIINRKYSLDDIIGKTGVEEEFESYLNGKKGNKTVAVNSLGSTIESVSELAPVPGDDVYLTLDANLQRKAEECLENGLKALQTAGTYESEWGNYKYPDAYKNATSASLVALDVNTGEVLALANYPSYDLNLFATGISSEAWNSLLNDSKNPLAPKPLYNIALLTAIQPGSTFKMITGLAALEKGISPDAKVYCAGVMEVGQRKFGCWIYNMRHGIHQNQDIYQAIRNSCNFYFFTSMLGENPATGQKHGIKLDFDDVTNMAKKFGLDDPTGIEISIPKEYSGGVPNIEGKKSSTRLYLRLFLEENLQYYIKDDYEMSSEELSNAINTVLSWINSDENIMTRSEVYKGLEAININPEKTHNSSTPIVDIIKYTYINNSVWNVGDSLNISIGQGDNAYTPIQMVNYVATIANGGYKHNVSVLDKCVSYDGKTITKLGDRISNRVELKDYKYLDIVKYGMKLVADDSSILKTLPIQCAVKTGTAQKDGINPETGLPYDDFAWYVAFAPYDNPKIAISCVIFQGGLGTYPATIVRDVIAEYLVEEGLLERPAKPEEESKTE